MHSSKNQELVLCFLFKSKLIKIQHVLEIEQTKVIYAPKIIYVFKMEIYAFVRI